MENNFRKKGDDEINYLNTVIKYQDFYILQLEKEIYKLIGEERLNFHREETNPANEYSIITRAKIEAIFRAAYSLQKKLDQVISESKIPLEKLLEDNCPPPDYHLHKVANIGLYPLSIPTMNHKEVILKWKYGKEEFGNALYLSTKELENIGAIGYIIERFFFDVCESRIKHIKGKK